MLRTTISSTITNHDNDKSLTTLKMLFAHCQKRAKTDAPLGYAASCLILQLILHQKLTRPSSWSDAWQAFSETAVNDCIRLWIKLDSKANHENFRERLSIWIAELEKYMGAVNKNTILEKREYNYKLPFKLQTGPQEDKVGFWLTKPGKVLENLYNLTPDALPASRKRCFLLLELSFDYVVHQLSCAESAEASATYLTSVETFHTLLCWLRQQQPELLEQNMLLRFYHTLFAVYEQHFAPGWNIKTALDHLQKLLCENAPCNDELVRLYALACQLSIINKKLHDRPDFTEIHLSDALYNKILATLDKNLTQPPAALSLPSLLEPQDLTQQREVFIKYEKQILTAQSLFSQTVHNVLNQCLDRAVSLLGKPPCRFGFLVLGSNSRQDCLPYSDVELALLYEPESKAKSEQTNVYIATLISLLEAQIIFLGESHKDHQGIMLDRDTSLRFNPGLRNSPEEVLKHSIFNKERHNGEHVNTKHQRKLHSFLYDPSMCSLLHAKLLNSDYGGQSLFECYQQQLHAYLNQPVSKVLLQEFWALLPPTGQPPIQAQPPAQALPNRHVLALWLWWDMLRHAEDGWEKFEQSKEIDIKKALHKPLVYLAASLRLYYGLPNSCPEDIFQAASQQKLLPAKLAEGLIKLLTLSANKRAKEHLEDEQQKDCISWEALLDTEKPLLLLAKDMFQLFQSALEYYFYNLHQKSGKPFHLESILHDYTLKQLSTLKDKALEAYFTQWTRYLLFIQAPLDTHRYYYRELPIKLRQQVLAAAQFKLTTEHGSYDSSVIQNDLWDAPDEQGIRPSHFKAMEQWGQCLIQNMLTRSAQGQAPFTITIKSLTLGNYYLTPSITLALVKQGWLLKDGSFVKKQDHPIASKMSGNHLVIPYPLDNPKFYLKVFPEYPLMELFLNDLQKRLGTAQPREVDVWYWRCGHYEYPVLISEAVPGTSLLKILKDNNLSELNHRAYSEQILLACLLNFEDAKPECFIMQGSQLIAIDNDRWFVPAFKGYQLHAKNILFCFDAMQKPIDPVLREEFLCLNPQQLLEHWLDKIIQWGKHCQKVFGGKIADFYQSSQGFLSGSKSPAERSMLLPPLPPQTVNFLFDMLERLQNELSHKPHMTLWEVAAIANPRLANHYQRACQQYIEPLRRFDIAIGQAYQRGQRQQSDYHTSHIDFNAHAEMVWGHLPSKEQLVSTWNRDIALAWQQIKILSKDSDHLKIASDQLQQGNLEGFTRLSLLRQAGLLTDFSFQLLTPVKQRELINYLKTCVGLRRLTLNYSSILQDSDVQELLRNLKHLTQLAIHDAPLLTEVAFKNLPQHQSLQQLYLSKLPQLKYLGYLPGFLLSELEIDLPHLIQLSLKACDKLEQININAAHLQNLQVYECPALKVLQTKSKTLQQFILDQCPLIKPQQLPAIASYLWPLQTFNQGMQGLTPLYQLFQNIPWLMQIKIFYHMPSDLLSQLHTTFLPNIQQLNELSLIQRRKWIKNINAWLTIDEFGRPLKTDKANNEFDNLLLQTIQQQGATHNIEAFIRKLKRHGIISPFIEVKKVTSSFEEKPFMPFFLKVKPNKHAIISSSVVDTFNLTLLDELIRSVFTTSITKEKVTQELKRLIKLREEWLGFNHDIVEDQNNIEKLRLLLKQPIEAYEWNPNFSIILEDANLERYDFVTTLRQKYRTRHMVGVLKHQLTLNEEDVKFFQKQLMHPDKVGIGDWREYEDYFGLDNLGIIYIALQEYVKSINFEKESLKAVSTIPLVNLFIGDDWFEFKLNDSDKSIPNRNLYKQWVEKKKEFNFLREIATLSKSIKNYLQHNEYQKALDSYRDMIKEQAQAKNIYKITKSSSSLNGLQICTYQLKAIESVAVEKARDLVKQGKNLQIEEFRIQYVEKLTIEEVKKDINSILDNCQEINNSFKALINALKDLEQEKTASLTFIPEQLQILYLGLDEQRKEEIVQIINRILSQLEQKRPDADSTIKILNQVQRILQQGFEEKAKKTDATSTINYTEIRQTLNNQQLYFFIPAVTSTIIEQPSNTTTTTTVDIEPPAVSYKLPPPRKDY